MGVRAGAVGVVLVAGLVLALPASADLHGSSSACQRLQGQDLAPANDVKLVTRHYSDGDDLLGCVLPAGPVRQVASSTNTYTRTETWTVRQVAHAIVLVYFSGSSQYGFGTSTYAYDVASGRDYTLAEICRDGDIGLCPSRPDTNAPRAYVNSAGQAVAAIRRVDTNTIRIVGFSSHGRRTRFDIGLRTDIPPSSLRLHGHTATWTHSGAPRTAELSG